MTGDHAARRQSGRKAVLFCRACGHDAPLGAGWDMTDSGHGHTEIACTECGHVIVAQPTFDDADESDALLTPVAELISTVVETSVSSSRFAGRLH